MKRDSIEFENEKVSVLFRKLLIPTFIGSIAMSLMTVIDGIFVGHGVGADGVAAVNIVVPIYQIVSGVGLMLGAGCSVVASIHLSRHNIKAARLNVTQAIITASILMIVLSSSILLFPEKTAQLLGSSESLMPKVIDYAVWIMPAYLFQIWSTIGLFIIRLDGSPQYAMWCNIVPALLNIFLDWLFIFPLNMGVKGAAIATAISLIVGGIMAMTYLAKFAKSIGLIKLKMSMKSFKLSLRNMLYQCKVGSSSMLGELTLASLIYCGNLMFMKYLGDDGVGAFGIVCYYMPFFFMIGNSIAQSAQPIISYNYGISRWKTIIEARNMLIATAAIVGVFVALFFLLVPKSLVALFVDVNSNAGMIAINGFPYVSIGVVLFVLNVAIIGYFQSVEKIKKATLYVFLRGFLLLVPIFLLLPNLIGVNGLWLAMPVTELLTLLVILCHWRIGTHGNHKILYNE